MTRYGLARAVSIVLHPMVVLVLATGIAARRLPGMHVSRAMLVVAVVAVIPFTVYMVWQVRRGRWENVDASRPAERPRLFVAGLALTALLALALQQVPSVAFLSRGVFAVTALLLAAWVLLRWVKVSLHVACLSMVAVMMVRTSLPVALIFAALVPVLAWARLTMERHTLADITAGAGLGAAAGLVVLV